jgi:hypothetical protein
MKKLKLILLLTINFLWLEGFSQSTESLTLQESNERLTDCLQIREDRDLLEKQNNLYIESLMNYRNEVGENRVVIKSLIFEGKKCEEVNLKLTNSLTEKDSKIQALRTQRTIGIIVTAVLTTILIVKK